MAPRRVVACLPVVFACAALAVSVHCGGGGGGGEGASGGDAGSGSSGDAQTAQGDARATGTTGTTGTSGDGATTSVPPDPSGPAVYPAGVVQAPITQNVLATMTNVLANGQRDNKRFLKVGDANCGGEMTPFDPKNPYGLSPMPGIPTGTQAAVQYFLPDTITGPDSMSTASVTESSFVRFSYACAESGTASGLLDAPSILDQEVTATNAAFALVGLGGVEMYDVNFDSLRHELDVLNGFDSAMLDVVDHLMATGVVPVVRAFPDKVSCSQCIDYNAPAGCNCTSGPYTVFDLGTMFQSIVRGIAQGRQVPFADVNVLLAQEGAQPGDWYEENSGHLSANPDNDPADFTVMKYGYPTDILVALQQLDRMRQFAQGSYAAEANPGPAQVGTGTMADPFVMPSTPYTDLRSFSGAQPSPITDYSSCAGMETIDGPAYFYRLDLAAPTAVRVLVYDRTNSPAQAFLRHFVGSVDIKNCQASKDAVQTYDDYYGTTLAAGTHYFTVASPKLTTGGSNSAPPEFGLVVQPCPDGDPRCM